MNRTNFLDWVSLFLMATVMIFVSCNVEKDRILDKKFPIEKELKSKRLSIDETLNPGDFRIVGDFFVFQNEYISGEDCFYVFDRDMKFCYSFGRLGNGPQEFIGPRIIHGKQKENQFYIFDPAYGKLFEYNLRKDNPVFVSELKVEIGPFPSQHTSIINDSILVYVEMNNEHYGLFSYNYNQHETIDSLIFQTPFKELLGNKYNSSYDGFGCSTNGNKFVLTFNYIDEIKIGEIDSVGRFVIDKTFEEGTFNSSYSPKKSDNLTYYIFPEMSDRHIYAPYYGLQSLYLMPFPFNPYGRSFKFLIEVYDLNKSPIARLSLDSDLLRIVVDEKNGKLYTWNILKDFDYLLEYDISFLID